MSRAEALAVALAVIQAQAAARRADYQALREDGVTVTEAARKVGVARRTGLGYDLELRGAVPGDPTQAEGRRDDYAELRAKGKSVADAAERLGVTVRTGWRYEAWLRARTGADR